MEDEALEEQALARIELEGVPGLTARVERRGRRDRVHGDAIAVLVERLDAVRERVAVDGLDRGDPLQQRVDARPPTLTLLPVGHPLSHRRRGARRVLAALDLGLELLELGPLV